MLRRDKCITREGIEKWHSEVLSELGFKFKSGYMATKGPYAVGICADERYFVSYYGDIEIYEDFQSCYDFIMEYAEMYPTEFEMCGDSK